MPIASNYHLIWQGKSKSLPRMVTGALFLPDLWRTPAPNDIETVRCRTARPDQEMLTWTNSFCPRRNWSKWQANVHRQIKAWPNQWHPMAQCSPSLELQTSRALELESPATRRWTHQSSTISMSHAVPNPLIQLVLLNDAFSIRTWMNNHIQFSTTPMKCQQQSRLKAAPKQTWSAWKPAVFRNSTCIMVCRGSVALVFETFLLSNLSSLRVAEASANKTLLVLLKAFQALLWSSAKEFVMFASLGTTHAPSSIGHHMLDSKIMKNRTSF